MHAHLRRPAFLAGGLALAAVTATAPFAAAGEDEPVTPHVEQVALVDGTDAQPLKRKSRINGTAQVASYDGRYVVFSSTAPLVATDTNKIDDVYLRDRSTGTTVLVSGHDGAPGDDGSFEPTISDDGRFVAFTTWATNLAKRTGSEALDVVVRDMETGSIRLVSRSTEGKPGDRNSFHPVISGNGRFVSFQTFSSFSGKDDDRKEDVYWRDTQRERTRQVSLLPGGSDVRGGVINGDITDNGRLVVFGNAEMLWMRDVRAGETVRFHHEALDAQCQPVEGMASAGRPVISGDGSTMAFSSCSKELVGKGGSAEIFTVDVATGERTRRTFGNASSYLPSLSRTGQYLAFGSDADNFVDASDTGWESGFRMDLATGEIVRVTQGPDGSDANSKSASNSIAINGDGRVVVFHSYADNLVVGDQSNYDEVFAWVS